MPDPVDELLESGKTREDAIHEGLVDVLKALKRPAELAEVERFWKSRAGRK